MNLSGLLSLIQQVPAYLALVDNLGQRLPEAAGDLSQVQGL